MASLTAYPPNVRADGTALLVFKGPADVSLTWSVVGTGAISDASLYTDARGMASAKYTPGTVGATATVTVTYGA
jgi:type 1 fimbria pilin